MTDQNELSRKISEITEEAQYCEALVQDNARLRERLRVEESDLVFLYGEEQDFYESEIKGLLLSVLAKESLQILSKRSKDVVSRLLEAQSEHKMIDRREQDLKACLRGTTLDKKQPRAAIAAAGFELSLQGNGEYGLCYYDDDRYCATAPNTPGDHRSILNLASWLCNIAY